MKLKLSSDNYDILAFNSNIFKWVDIGLTKIIGGLKSDVTKYFGCDFTIDFSNFTEIGSTRNNLPNYHSEHEK